MLLTKGVKLLEIAGGQFFVRPGSPETWFQTEILTKEIWGWGWGSNSDPNKQTDKNKHVGRDGV